ncbi:uncharacterized protein RJT20DRAFT_128264 [Scheffersomyces xylosifermentans]|uniref:uncharacterized protein n=1 Tax=Scheffersomyces xylosifermentans TaxID=1304137 RepID=UPI00315D26B7
MVAEPVQATLETLGYFYNLTSDFIATQQERIEKASPLDKLSGLDLHANSSNGFQMSLRKANASIWDRLCRNIGDNKLKYLTILSIGLGGGTYWYYRKVYQDSASSERRQAAKYKRRVPKLPNGARRDVILIVGSPTEPLTRLIALDFEKRGFIVYLTILDEKDYKYVESNPITDDINYLNLNDSFSYESQLTKFHQLLELPVIPFPGAGSHNLRLVAVVFAPSLYFPIGPIENISVPTWTKVTDRELLYLKLFSSGLISLIRNQQSKTILINTNIVSSLELPYHAPETIFQNHLKHLFTTLTREVRQHGLSVTQVRLGNLRLSTQRATSDSRIANLVNSEIRSWDEDIKELYADSFSKSQYKSNPIKSTGGKGTSLHELYHILFDLVYSQRKNPTVVYCGTGARSYDIISTLLPTSWLEWFLR